MATQNKVYKRKNKHTSWTVFLIITLVFFGVLSFEFFSLYLKYPWRSFSSEGMIQSQSYFSTHWPVSLLTDERQLQKKIKKFAKAERLRRQERHEKRMESVRASSSDIIRDPATAFEQASQFVNNQSYHLMEWPTLATQRGVGTFSSKKFVSYLTQPQDNGSLKLIEGVSMEPGDELKFSVPKVSEFQFLALEAYPQNPGTIRVVSGNNVWVNSFEENQIGQMVPIIMPFGDGSGVIGKIVSVSARVFMSQANVMRTERLARIAIQVSKESRLFAFDKSRLPISDGTAQLEDTQNEGEEPEEEPEIVGEKVASEKTVDDKVSAEDSPVIKQTTVKETNEVSDDLPYKIPPYLAKKDALDLNKLLSRNFRENRQVLKDSPGTVALGYNILVLQVGSVSRKLLTDIRQREKLLLGQATLFNDSVWFPHFEADALQKKVLMEDFLLQEPNARNFSRESETGQGLVSRSFKNFLVPLFRDFGYRTVLISNHESLMFPRLLNGDKKLKSLQGKWLEPSDWRIVQDRNEFDSRNDSTSGLEAIFKSVKEKNRQAFTETEMDQFVQYAQKTSLAKDGFFDWLAHDIFVIPSEKQYTSLAVENFQNWLKQNEQSRFFAAVNLNPNSQKMETATQDYLRIFKLLDLGLLWNEEKAMDLARAIVTDRALAQIQEALVAKSMEHRTIVAVIFHHKDDGSSSFSLKIPGLAPKVNIRVAETIYSKDAAKTLLSLVGLEIPNAPSAPRGQTMKDDSSRSETAVTDPVNNASEVSSVTLISNVSQGVGQNLDISPALAIQKPNVTHSSLSNNYEYHAYFLGNQKNCVPLEWVSDSELEDLKSSHPSVERLGKKSLVFYPCELNQASVHIQWVQKMTQRELSRSLGGHINWRASDMAKGFQPQIYLGKDLYKVELVSLLQKERYLRFLADKSLGDPKMLTANFELNIDRLLSDRSSWSLEKKSDQIKMLLFRLPQSTSGPELSMNYRN